MMPTVTIRNDACGYEATEAFESALDDGWFGTELRTGGGAGRPGRTGANQVTAAGRRRTWLSTTPAAAKPDSCDIKQGLH